MINKEEIENLIEDMTKLRPDQLSEEGQKLFNTIMTIIDERDYYLERYKECNNAFIERRKEINKGGQKMAINKTVEQMINLGATLIEINPIQYRQLNENTLQLLKTRNVKVDITDKVKTVFMYKYNVDCFAYLKNDKINGCFCLNELYCRKELCKFYKKKTKAKKEYLETYNLTTANMIAKNIDRYFRDL